MLKITRCFKKFLRAGAGAVAIEFAIVAPLLLLLIVGIIQISLIMYVQDVMETVAYNDSRLGQTGYASTGQSRAATITADIVSRTQGLIDPSQITWTAASYSSYSAAGTPSAGQDVGDAGDIVIYTFNCQWPILPFMQQFFGDSSGNMNITARAVVQNEPF